MRICYVSRECSPYTGGGIGTYIRNVLVAMLQQGHEVTLLSDFLGDIRFQEIVQELSALGIIVLIPDALPQDIVDCYYHPHHAYADRVYHTLQRYINEYTFDVIEFAEYRAEGFTCIRAKRLLGAFPTTNLVVKCHTPSSLLLEINNQPTSSEQVSYAIYMEDYVVAHADRVTSPSQSLATYYQQRLERADIAISRYPLTLPTNAQAVQIDTRERSLVYVGRIEWRKGVDLLIKALIPIFRSNADVVLDCYGADTPTGPFDTSFETYLRRRVIPADIADRIYFHGSVPYAEVLQHMASATLCIFPSRWENWANVCLEAMSLGRPVIVSAHGGMAEMVEEGQSGFIVDPHNSARVAECVQALLDDPAFARHIGEHAAIRARELCDYERCAHEIEQSYGALILPSFQPTKVIDALPLISIIIPFYNQGAWLEEAVASALASTYPHIEVIVVNDGSTDDDSLAIFDRLHDQRLQKVTKSNGGLSSARNAGIAIAKGTFILPLDSDDLIDEQYIAVAAQALINNPQLAYVTCYVKNFGIRDDYYIPVGLVQAMMLLSNPAGKCCSLFRRTALDDVGLYDEFMISFEDWDLLNRLASTSWEGDVLPEVHFFYRRHSDSMVYQDALPKQAQLMQYMASKHHVLLQTHARSLFQVLVEKWLYEHHRATAQLNAMTADRDRLWAETQQWHQQYEQAQGNLKDVVEQQQQTQREVTWLSGDRDRLWGEVRQTAGERDQFWNEAQQVASERDQFWNEAQQVASERDQFWNEAQQIASERDQFWNEAQQIASERDQFWNEAQQIASERDRFLQEARTWQEQAVTAQAELQTIKQSRLWQRIERLRNNNTYQRTRSAAWRTRSWLTKRGKSRTTPSRILERRKLKEVPSQRSVTIRVTGNHHSASGGSEAWLLDLHTPEGEPIVSWDALNIGLPWRVLESGHSRSGQAIVADGPATLVLAAPEDAVLRFLSHPWSGIIEVEGFGRTQTVDLYAPYSGVATVDLSTSLTNGGATHGQPNLTPQWTAEEQAWIQRMQEHHPAAIGIMHPDWRGVRSCMQNLFSFYLLLDDKVDETKADRVAHMLVEAGITRVMLGAFPLSYSHLVHAIKRRAPHIQIAVLWLGTFLQSNEDYNWAGFNQVDQFCRAGLVDKWGFAKQGMAEVVGKTGVTTGFVMSYVRSVPQQPSTPLVGGPHLGVWAIEQIWRKSPYAMLAASSMIPHAQVMGRGQDERVREFARFLKLDAVLHDAPLPQGEMAAALAQMHLNLYVTLSECSPMLPLESLAAGAPCLIGPTSHLFEDDPYLHSRLVVPGPDRSLLIARYIEQALAERNDIVAAYRAYAPGYNARAQQSLRDFFEVDSNAVL